MAMGQDYSSNLFADINTASNYTAVLLTTSAKSLIWLIQQLQRLHRENILKKNEIDDFLQFSKVTQGNFSIHNVVLPTSDKEVLQGMDEFDSIQDIKNELSKMGIHYHVLPDLNPADHSIQICVYEKDAQKFSAFMLNHTKTLLSGGEMSAEDIQNVTQGKASIVSFHEDAFDKMKETMDMLNISYGVLPDLNLNDTDIQITMPTSQVPVFQEALAAYRRGLLKENRDIGEATTMSFSEYQATGNMSEQDYIQTAPDEVVDSLKKYDKEDNKYSQAYACLSHNIESTDGMHFRHYLENNHYDQLSIDDGTLKTGLANAMEAKSPENFYCRIPTTYGKKEQVLQIPKEQVFEVKGASKKRYIAFIHKEEAPIIYGTDMKQIEKFATGNELYHFFDEVNKQKNQNHVSKTNRNDKAHNFDERPDNDWNEIERLLLEKEMEQKPEALEVPTPDTAVPEIPVAPTI